MQRLSIVSAAVAFAAAMLLHALAGVLRRAGRSLRARRRATRSLRGERDAERLLARSGYRIEARQVTRRWQIACDGTDLEVLLRADLLVRRGRRRFVAEVKTGDSAPAVTNASTRRQLLEYRVAYDVDGVLLVDVEQGDIVEVAFPLAHGGAGSRRSGARAAAVAIAAGFVLGAGAASAAVWLGW